MLSGFRVRQQVVSEQARTLCSSSIFTCARSYQKSCVGCLLGGCVLSWIGDFCVSSSGISLGWIASGEKYPVARLVSLGY